MNNNIKWTKRYDVNHKLGFFKIYISLHEDQIFYGGVVYYTKSGTFLKDDLTLDLRLESFMGDDEETVFQSCKQWIEKNLGTEFKITDPE